MKTLLNWNWTW